MVLMSVVARDEKREAQRQVRKVVTREWRKAKVLNWNLHSFQLLEIIQVLDSISWVCCASGNVYFNVGRS